MGNIEQCSYSKTLVIISELSKKSLTLMKNERNLIDLYDNHNAPRLTLATPFSTIKHKRGIIIVAIE